MTDYFIKTNENTIHIEGVDSCYEDDKRIKFRSNDGKILNINRDCLEFYFDCDFKEFLRIPMEKRKHNISINWRIDEDDQ